MDSTDLISQARSEKILLADLAGEKTRGDTSAIMSEIDRLQEKASEIIRCMKGMK